MKSFLFFLVIRDLRLVLSNETVRKFLMYQPVTIITALLELTSIVLISSILTFYITGSPSQLFEHLWRFLEALGLGVSEKKMSSILLLAMMVSGISSMLSIINVNFLSKFSAYAGSELNNNLFQTYMKKKIHIILEGDKDDLLRKLTLDSNRITDNLLQPLAQINAKIFTALALLTFLTIQAPLILSIIGTVFICTYGLIFFTLKNSLKRSGTRISASNQEKIMHFRQSLNAFLEVKFYGQEENFVKQLSKTNNKYASDYRLLNVIYNMPKIAIDFVVMQLLVVSLLVVTLVFDDTNINMTTDFFNILPLLGLSAFKLLPIFQQLYNSFAQMKAHYPALIEVAHEFIDTEAEPCLNRKLDNFPPVEKIKLSGVSYSYKTKLKQLNFDCEFRVGSINFICGPSGSGKSTLANLLVGALPLERGKIILKTSDRIRSHNSEYFSYTPQDPFLLNGTLKYNITFSNDELEKPSGLQEILEVCGLSDRKHLDIDAATILGEGQRKLSGGQVKRIGIARSLYQSKSILVFDEPTSGLDRQTANRIMKYLRKLASHKIVVCITHNTQDIDDDDSVLKLN